MQIVAEEHLVHWLSHKQGFSRPFAKIPATNNQYKLNSFTTQVNPIT